MKRLLSAILAIAMILALVPAVMAAGDAIELDLSRETNEIFKNSDTDTASLDTASGIALTGMHVRRYEVAGPSGPAVFIKFNVPSDGRYTLEIKTNQTGYDNRANAAAPAVYVGDYRATLSTQSKIGLESVYNTEKLGYFDFSEVTGTEYAPMTINTDGVDTKSAIEFELSSGNHFMVFHCGVKSLDLNNIMSTGDPLTGYDKLYTNGKLSGISTNGTSIINKSFTQNIYISGIRLIPVVEEPAEDEKLTNAFKPDNSDATVYAPSVDAVTTVAGTSATKKADGSYEMVAPETDANGNKFLYWAKGLSLNKRIVSLEREFTYTPATGERNFLIPVYAPESATNNEYYNANGQLIDCAAEAPALPSMAGYGKASGWAQYEDTNIYVAEYNNKTQPDNVKVTVNGTENTVPYGTDITCTADDKDADNKPFKCWTKSGINGKEEIVSCDKNYTFKAWEDCTVTAVYEEHTYTGAKMKIIIDSFDIDDIDSETGIMAEFIGLDGAVEKGIMFGTQKIAMTKPGTQFTVTADESGTYKGYAIIEDGKGGYTLITDGSYTK